MTDQPQPSARTASPFGIAHLCRAALISLLAAAGLGASGALAQDGVVADARIFDLPYPAERIYPAGPEMILATSAEASSAMLIDARDGRIVGDIALDGRLRAAAAFVAPDSQAFGTKEGSPATVALLVEPAPGRLLLKRFHATLESGFAPAPLPDLELPLQMEDAGVAFLPFGRGGDAGGALVVWDRAPLLGGEYIFVWDAKMQPVGVKDYPGDMIPIGSSDWMLGLHLETSRASVLEVLSGSRDDNVLVEGLRSNSAETLDIFVPNLLYGGTGDALAANGSTRQLLALTARAGLPPLLDPPIQIALDALPTDSAGRIKPWVAADRALSLILVGADGTDQVQIMRRIGGGVATLGTVSLGIKVADAIALHGPAPTDPERFALLVEGGRVIAVVKSAAFETQLTAIVEAGQTEGPQPSPVVLNPSDIAQIQRVLAAFGYSVGVIDGLSGQRTAAAVRAFQLDNGLEANGLLDDSTLERLNAALNDTGVRTSQEAVLREYADYLNEVAGAGDLSARVMTLGVSQERPDHPCFGLNEVPPRVLWPNSVKFAALLRRLENELGRGVQVVSGYRTPAYNRCIAGNPRSGHQQFSAFDIRLADSGTFAESNQRLLAALERLRQAGFATFKVEPTVEASVHVETLLGEWQAVIASYSIDARGCGFASDDVDEFAELLSGTELTGREILVTRTVISGHYAVSVDLNNDAAAARAASALIRKVSSLSRDRRTGSDSFVQQNSDWFLDPDCAHVRVIR